MRTLRFTILAFVLFAALAVRAVAADDNWLLGTWASTGTPDVVRYIFTETEVALEGPDGPLGAPHKITSYDIEGDTIVVTAEGLPEKATVTKSDATHAKLDSGGRTVDLVKQ